MAGTSGDWSLTQAFNPSSQIVSQTRTNDAYAWTGAVAVNRNYTTNGLNQYSAAGTASFAYDANGNLTSDGSTTVLYDIENRLVSASGAKTATLTYDPMGRLWRVQGATTDTTFLYDGDELVAEYDSAGTLNRRYVHSDNADDPIVQYNGSAVGAANRYFLMPDERGSIIAIVQPDDTVQAINAYDEYGIPKTTTPGASVTGRFAYTGQIWLDELGMYYYKARVYSPTLGRFLQVDPIGYEDQVNLYSYVSDDPMNRADPTGLACLALNSSSPYCERAIKYAIFDGALGSKTRFFAAASATVAFLANMDYPIAGKQFTSPTMRSLLNSISSGLEKVNGNLALKVASGKLAGNNLDAQLVHIEQSAVQAGLDAYAKSSPDSYRQAVEEINGLLNASGPSRGAASLTSSDRHYLGVLDGVRRDLGRNIDFSKQSDREAIGNALAKDARDSGLCDRVGTRFKTC